MRYTWFIAIWLTAALAQSGVYSYVLETYMPLRFFTQIELYNSNIAQLMWQHTIFQGYCNPNKRYEVWLRKPMYSEAARAESQAAFTLALQDAQYKHIETENDPAYTVFFWRKPRSSQPVITVYGGSLTAPILIICRV